MRVGNEFFAKGITGGFSFGYKKVEIKPKPTWKKKKEGKKI